MAILANSSHRVAARGSAAAGRQVSKLDDSEAAAAAESEVTETGAELCQVGEMTSTLPFELFELPDLKSVLSLETWNFYLSEEEREKLLAFMPSELDQETFSTTLKDIFSGANVFFGNPVDQLFEQMKAGQCQPRVAQFREGLKCLQKKEHYHLLRKYHNTMVSSFVEMQKLWEEYPDVEIEGRLEIWRKWKETKVKPQLPIQKSFNAVQKAKPPPEAAKIDVASKSKDGKAGTANAGASKAPTVWKGGVKVEKTGKSGVAKGGVVKKGVKPETQALSPASEPETVGGNNDSTPGGTSSSLTSGERTRKTLMTMRREDESMSSLEADDFQDTCRSIYLERKAADAQCVANFEASNEEIDAATQKRRPKRKAPADKSSSESPPQTKLSRKIGPNFPFSIILFLSSLRRALLTPFEGEDGGVKNSATGPSSPCEENSDDPSKADCFPVPFSEIVRRVHAVPGDPQVLDAQEPVQDLVWGALKVLSSKVAPAGAKGWKPLASYEKETKSWYWIGPSGYSVDENENLLADDWGVPSKILMKVEEAFAAWYKLGEATRQQMEQLQLPPPPAASAFVDDKERFRDMRAQKSLITIAPSSEDMRAYFRKEEILRYSVPDRAFAYTRSDGLKSVVAPLRRGGGKPNSKARDHFMLKPDRPPHVTILCLVRDAASRLPGGVGTRADVCALIRDSQFVVEDVSEAQVNQVVSGALDRLHYERDPCVRFDSDRKLWVYLHTSRNEDDFEDDGTSSTKRWKKQKKDGGEGGGGELQQQQQQQQHLGCFDNGSPYGGEQDVGGYGIELGSSSSSAIYSAGRTELVYNNSGSLASPRVLHNSGLVQAEDAAEGGGGGGIALMELPPPSGAVQLQRSSWEGWKSQDGQ